jgi:hypothetical protein
MAYVEVHQSLLGHWKTLRLSRMLQMDRFAVVGRLMALWSWAIDNAPEGWVATCDVDLLADVMGWEGEPRTLCDALLTAGFLDSAEGAFVLHEWMDYAGRLMEQRRANAKRQQAWRDRNKADDHSSEVRNGDVTVTSASRNGATVPNRTPSVDAEVSSDGDGEIIVAAAAAPPVEANASPVMTDPVPDEKSPAIGTQRKPAPLKPLFGEDSPPMQLAQYLASHIRSHKPDAKIPRDLQGWAREFDLMLRVDKRPRDAITATIDFGVAPVWWTVDR